MTLFEFFKIIYGIYNFFYFYAQIKIISRKTLILSLAKFLLKLSCLFFNLLHFASQG